MQAQPVDLCRLITIAQQGDAPEKVSLKLCYDASPQNLINTSPVILNVGPITYETYFI
jgi:hypothetical protein